MSAGPWQLTVEDVDRGVARANAMAAMSDALLARGPLSGPDLMAVAGYDAPSVGALRLLREGGFVRRLRCGCFALIATWRPT